MKKKILCISHTHWDREWYLTKENFRMMLIDLVDRAIKILQEDETFTCFMLDGQTIVLEDYLVFRPEKKDEIKQLVTRGRLIIGPWYILPDEYLISPEGHIRNYLLGQDICSAFGGSMQHGYLPDSFGHPSQIPQILNGLGLKDAIFWRGLGKDITTTEFYWKGIDGSHVLAVNMPYSYGIGACLPDDRETLVERFRVAVDRLEPLTSGDVLLYMQGVDHVAPDPQLPEKLRQLNQNQELGNYEAIQGSLDTYLKMIDTECITETTEGELRSGYRAYLLGGTLSSRGYLKQRAFETERLLTSYAEPLAVLANLYGDVSVPYAHLQQAWKLYLDNMPHDSICGCSIDEVHEEMMIRFRDLDTICQHIVDTSAVALQKLLDLPNDGKSDSTMVDGRDGFFLFNPLPFSRNETVTVTIPYEQALLRQVVYMTGDLTEYQPEFLQPVPTAVMITDPKGNTALGKIIDTQIQDRMDLSLERQPVMYRVRYITIRCSLVDIQPLSFSAYRCTWKFSEQPDEAVKDTAVTDTSIKNSVEFDRAVIENSFYRISVEQAETKTEASAASEKASAASASGKEIVIYDKRLDRTFKDVLYFKDSGDAGDLYTYSPPAEDMIIRSQIIDVTLSDDELTIISGMMIPESLSKDRSSRCTELVEHQIKMVIKLEDYSDLIRISISADNAAKDHRLRLIASLPVTSGRSWAEGHFCIDEREPVTVYRSDQEKDPECDKENDHEREKEDYSDWIEPPGTFFQKRFAALADSDLALVVMNHGLHEYEVISSKEGFALAVTLIRSVGWLSRADLLARKGNGGWSLETPAAQVSGPAEFTCALQIRASLDYGKLMRSVQEFSTPSMSFPLQEKEGRNSQVRKHYVSALEFSNDTMVFSALKPAQSGLGYILRWTNYSEEKTTQQVKFNNPLSSVIQTDLAERQISPLKINEKINEKGNEKGNENTIKVELNPWTIASMKICPDKGEKHV